MADRNNKLFSGKKPASINTEATLQTPVNRAKSFRGGDGNAARARADSIGSLEELVQCGICLERLSQPRMLPCQHTFCLSCLESNVATEEKTTAHCHTCNTEYHLERGAESLNEFPSNVYINSLLKLLESSVEPQTPGSNDASAPRCVKCEIVCLLEGHKCDHCKQFFCKVCWLNHMNDLGDKLAALLKQLEDSEIRLVHKMEDFEVRCEQLNEAIRQTTENRIVELRSRETAVLKQVEALKIVEKTASDVIMGKADDLKKNLEKINFNLVDQYQKVSIFMNFHRNTSKILDDISRWGETRTIFDSDAFRLDEDSEGINSEVDEETQLVNGVRFSSDPLENVGSLELHYKSRSFTPKLCWTKCPRPAGVAVSPWSNNIYIAATDSRFVLILNRQKVKVVGKLSAPDMLCPQKIAFSKNRKEIYVTDKWKHCVHVFSSYGDYLRSLCSRGSSEGKVRSPEGIAVTSDDEIILCDTGNDRILILEPEQGRQLCQIGWHGKRTVLNMPTDVAVAGDRTIVVADSGNHRVRVFNMTGTQLQEFGSLGREKGQFRSPEVVAVDPLGFVLVGDAGNSRIQIFDADGKLVRVFGGAGQGAGKFKWISGIVVTPHLEIIVTDNKNRSLQIF